MSSVSRVTPSAPMRRLFLPLVAITVASVIIATVAVRRMAGPSPGAAAEPTVRFSIELPPGVQLNATSSQRLAISPDGTRIAFNGETAAGRRLFVRSLDQVDPAPISGVEGAIGSLFFSPGGDWIAFNDTTSGSFRRVRVGGGPVATITDARAASDGFRGASWGEAGTIAFATAATTALMQVGDAGGSPQPLTRPGNGELHGQPHFLPGGKALLFTATRPGVSDRIIAFSREEQSQRDLLDGTTPRYATSGHLVFLRDQSLWAAPFDAASLQLTGDAVPLIDEVGVSGSLGVPGFGANALYDIDRTGTLVYTRKGDGRIVVVLHWFDELRRRAAAR